jgi:hypothetical protein
MVVGYSIVLIMLFTAFDSTTASMYSLLSYSLLAGSCLHLVCAVEVLTVGRKLLQTLKLCCDLDTHVIKSKTVVGMAAVCTVLLIRALSSFTLALLILGGYSESNFKVSDQSLFE